MQFFMCYVQFFCCVLSCIVGDIKMWFHLIWARLILVYIAKIIWLLLTKANLNFPHLSGKKYSHIIHIVLKGQVKNIYKDSWFIFRLESNTKLNLEIITIKWFIYFLFSSNALFWHHFNLTIDLLFTLKIHRSAV